MSDQKADPFETPSRDDIPEITRGHVAAMEASDGEPEEIWVMHRMSHLMLRTIGRRSGRVHKVALPYWLDRGGAPIVVASFAGAPKHPAWYLNVTDRKANPEVYVRMRREAFWADPQVLGGEEYETIWEQMIADRPFYEDYQALTERRLPLIRIVKKRPAKALPSDD
jgi:deazaflavin-dependent oxidoreductase (nitroreductase family)